MPRNRAILLSTDLEKKLRIMRDLPRTPRIDRGFEDAAQHIHGLVRNEAPEGETGNLLKGIVYGRSRSKNNPGAFVASRARHSAIINFGTAQRFHASGKSVGKVKANPFFSRGIRMGSDKATDIISQALAEEAISVTRI